MFKNEKRTNCEKPETRSVFQHQRFEISIFLADNADHSEKSQAILSRTDLALCVSLWRLQDGRTRSNVSSAWKSRYAKIIVQDICQELAV